MHHPDMGVRRVLFGHPAARERIPRKNSSTGPSGIEAKTVRNVATDMFGQTRNMSARAACARGRSPTSADVAAMFENAVAEANSGSISSARSLAARDSSYRGGLRVEEHDGLAGMERPELGVLGAQADRGIQLAEPFLGATRDAEELAEERARDCGMLGFSSTARRRFTSTSSRLPWTEHARDRNR